MSKWMLAEQVGRGRGSSETHSRSRMNASGATAVEIPNGERPPAITRFPGTRVHARGESVHECSIPARRPPPWPLGCRPCSARSRPASSERAGPRAPGPSSAARRRARRPGTAVGRDGRRRRCVSSPRSARRRYRGSAPDPPRARAGAPHRGPSRSTPARSDSRRESAPGASSGTTELQKSGILIDRTPASAARARPAAASGPLNTDGSTIAVSSGRGDAAGLEAQTASPSNASKTVDRRVRLTVPDDYSRSRCRRPGAKPVVSS